MTEERAARLLSRGQIRTPLEPVAQRAFTLVRRNAQVLLTIFWLSYGAWRGAWLPCACSTPLPTRAKHSKQFLL